MKIKRIIAICAVAGVLASCAPKGYVLDGTLANAEGAKVVLVERLPMSDNRVDSTVVEKGRFRLEGRVETPALYRLEIDLNAAGTPLDELDYDKLYIADFYLENSPITFEGDINTMQTYFWTPERASYAPVIEGSSQQQMRLELDKRLAGVLDRQRALSRRMSEEYYTPMTEGGTDLSALGIELAREQAKIAAERRETTLAFVREFPDAAVSFDEVSFLFGDGSVSPFTAEQIDEMVAILEPAWKGTSRFEWLRGQAEQAKKLAIGQKFIDCEFYNLDGQKVKLSSVIPEGKFAMLEFWASWCGPCRGEIPHLKHVRKLYPDFDIISVSVDESADDWKKAIGEEQMDWVQLRDVGMVDGNAMKLYGVMGVPCCIVLDKEGRFFRTDMRGPYLDAFLQEIYGR